MFYSPTEIHSEFEVLQQAAFLQVLAFMWHNTYLKLGKEQLGRMQ